MDLDKLTKELLDKKAKENNTIDLNAYAIGMEDLKNQLMLGAVSNRRELLLDFLAEINGNLITHPHLQMSTRFVDDYLKSNNCC